jgi:hypothetical protein
LRGDHVRRAFPIEAWTKWNWVWKALVFAAFLPLTLRTKTCDRGAALIMVLSIGTIIIDGGIKTALGGGGYGVLSLLVREDSGSTKARSCRPRRSPRSRWCCGSPGTGRSSSPTGWCGCSPRG